MKFYIKKCSIYFIHVYQTNTYSTKYIMFKTLNPYFKTYFKIKKKCEAVTCPLIRLEV